MMTTLDGLDQPDRRSGRSLGVAAMHDIAGGFVVVPDIERLLPTSGISDGHRQVLLVATPTFEAWLIEWPTGAELAFHDHGCSSAVVHVRTGALIEQRGDVRWGWRHLGPGASTTLPPGATHTVRNAGRAPAVSVHVYSPPPVVAGTKAGRPVERAASADGSSRAG